MIFTAEGTDTFDFILINGQRDWATLPAGTIDGFDEDLPIRLQVGNGSFGDIHIRHKHAVWLQRQRQKHNQCLHTLLHTKLGQSGGIYCTEGDRKLKISMRLYPDALLVLSYTKSNKLGNFLTVITMYNHPSTLDGEKRGRYHSGYRHNHPAPAADTDTDTDTDTE